jgi:hypothetical protein
MAIEVVLEQGLEPFKGLQRGQKLGNLLGLIFGRLVVNGTLLRMIYRERFKETLERRERLRDRRMNCCMSALS